MVSRLPGVEVGSDVAGSVEVGVLVAGAAVAGISVGGIGVCVWQATSVPATTTTATKRIARFIMLPGSYVPLVGIGLIVH